MGITESIATIEQELETVQAAYHDARATKSRAESDAAADVVAATRAKLSAAIADGASPCPSCGEAPLGMRHPLAVKVGSEYKHGFRFEVGCRHCVDHRADASTFDVEDQQATRDKAVAKWNAGHPIKARMNALDAAARAEKTNAPALQEREQCRERLHAHWMRPKGL